MVRLYVILALLLFGFDLFVRLLPYPKIPAKRAGSLLILSDPPGARVARLQEGGRDPLPGVTTPGLDDWNFHQKRSYRLSAYGYKDQEVSVAPEQELVSVSMSWNWTYPFAVHPAASLAVVTLGLAWQQRRLRQEESLLVKLIEPDRPLTFGGYSVVRKLGDGAMGDVYLAVDESGKKVALKVLQAQHSQNEEFKIRFGREAEICKELNHPCIVRTYDWGLEGERYWMAQEYLPGGSLSTWVKPGGRHPTEVRKLLLKICQGLQYAHERGILHRDLKPANLLLNARGEPVIGDFGLARSASYETITADGDVLGTPAYMAPESIGGRPPDRLADLYAVGVIGYEMLTGRVPFEGDVVAVLVAKASCPSKPLDEVKPGIPAKLSFTVMKLLDRDPNQRYGSAQEVVDDLE